MTTYAVHPARTISLPRPLLVAAIAGPVLFLIGQALLPVTATDMGHAFPQMLAHRDQLIAARLFTAAGAFLLVPAAVWYARALPTGSRGARLLQVGAWVFGIATFCNALSQAVAGYATYTVTAPGFDPASAKTVIEQIETGLVSLPLQFWSIPAFALGSLLIAAALWRSDRIPMWLPVLLIVGTLLAAALAGRGLLVALTQAPFTAALVALAMVTSHRARRGDLIQ